MKRKLKRFLNNFKRSTLDIEPTFVDIPVKGKKFAKLKILHLSDLHINKKTSSEEITSFIETVNKQKVDFAVITGDIIDCRVSKIKQKLFLFKNIRHRVYFVSGNHDVFYGYKELLEVLDQCGVEVLDNRFSYLVFKGNKYILVGLGDRFSKYFKIKRDEKALVKEIQKKDSFKIFLAHQPKDYVYAKKAKAALFLCGHTHGGQIYPFHLLVRLVQPFLSGLHFVKGMAVYVSPGLGTWGIRYRFFANSEMAIIRLIKK